jgi:hypothetical protein
MRKNKEIFENIYKNRRWNGSNPNGPLSGSGSSLEYTEKLRMSLPSILEKFNVKTLLDAGCGDLTWMSVILDDIKVKYIGVDVVETLIEKHKQNFTNIEFHSMDITVDKLPAADMMLCRDCLFHMSNYDLFKTLRNFLSADIPYIFTTLHVTNQINYDIQTGEFRKLNLLEDPFNFPTPLYTIDDTYAHHLPRNMSIWSREQIEKVLQ